MLKLFISIVYDLSVTRIDKIIFEIFLSSVADVGIDNAEAFAEFFGKPCLLNSFLLKHFFDSIHGFIHRVQCSFDSAKI